jgi:hypothetical protein
MTFFTQFGAMPAQVTIGAALALMRPLGSPAVTPAGNLELSGEEKCTVARNPRKLGRKPPLPRAAFRAFRRDGGRAGCRKGIAVAQAKESDERPRPSSDPPKQIGSAACTVQVGSDPAPT